MDRNNILKKIQKSEDRLLISKVLDKAERAEKSFTEVHTDFLDPYQRALIEKVLKMAGITNYRLDGGFEGAEREILVFRPDYVYSDESEPGENFLKVLHLALNSRDALTHRDYLGAIMGLGIKREKIGDILVKEESCTIIVAEDIASYIESNLMSVGNAKVSVTVKDIEELQIPQARTKEIKTTVASLRLDSVAGAGFGMSRSKAAEMIKADRVNLNWVLTSDISKHVSEGDTISIRGRGRVVLEKVNGTTKRDRISIVLKRMI